MPESPIVPADSTNTATSVRIAANFTVEPIEEFLSFWLARLGIPAEIQFAPYNQVFQQLLEGGLLRTNRGGINLVALDLDAWLTEGAIDQASTQLNRAVDDLLDVLQSSGAQGAGGAVLLFPAAPATADRAAAVAEARKRLTDAVASIAGWAVVDLAPFTLVYGVSEPRDPFTDELGNIPFTEELYVAAATAVARWIRCTRTKARKVIVVDCDNTLWQGVCGEGPVQVTEPFRKLQEFLLRQRDEGMLLGIASKNNEDDVMAVLNSEQSILKPEHFTLWQINWQPKSENLNTLSEELGLALNSFIFLDDSPIECMEVRNGCPEVLTVTLPGNAEAIPAFLQHYWAFDRPPATDEDRNRASMYEAEKQRVDLSRRALTREEFLASLRIEIEIAKAAESDLQRIAQLTQRTTQFNMAGVQHTVQSLTDKLAQPGNKGWTVRVRDAFGDYGLVGAMVCEATDDGLRTDTFLLSCRALGRGVEDRMLDELRRFAQERGHEGVVIPFVPTARNRPALEFLSRVCEIPANVTEPFDCVIATSGSTSQWRSSAPLAPQPAAEKTPAATASAPTDEGELLAGIARHMQSADSILTAIRSGKRARPSDAGALAVPKPGVEEQLARIWSDCLAIEPIGANDHFFEFGGQSLLATRVLARIHAEFGISLGLTAMFERPTVALMAAHIAEAASSQNKTALPVARDSH
jgi:FkbH-like protein